MTNSEIGARIKSKRTELGLTLDDIAGEIGVAKSTIQRYEKGTIDKLKLPVLEAIARALHVNPAWLIGKSATPEEDSGKENPASLQMDDFTYAMHNHSGALTERDKEILLAMAQQLSDAHKKGSNGETDGNL